MRAPRRRSTEELVMAKARAKRATRADNSLDVLRALVEKDPRASDKIILDSFRAAISDRARSESLRDAQEQILIELVQMLKGELKSTKSLRCDQLNAENDGCTKEGPSEHEP
jgi:hypothetical protein